MKKNFFNYVIAMFIAVLTLFSSCEQQDDEMFSLDEKIVIKMSIPSTRSSTDQNTSRSIPEGDTINVYNLQDVNILISAETPEGWIIEGDWLVRLSGPEKGLLENDQNLWLSVRPSAYETKKSMVAIKPEKLGVYTVEFEKGNEVFKFYIRHYGLPGDIGDTASNDYIFRMEKNSFQDGNTGKDGYTIYLKSDEYIMGNKVKALIFTDNGSTFTAGSGFVLSAEELTCYKSEYSPGYIYFSFIPSEITPLYGMYTIDFYAGSYYHGWYRPESIYDSNWCNVGQIQFMDIMK